MNRYIVTEVALHKRDLSDDSILIKIQENGQYAICWGNRFLNKEGWGYRWEGGSKKPDLYPTIQACQSILDSLFT